MILVGDKVRVLSNYAAHSYNLDTLGLIGKEFVVKEIISIGDNAYVVQEGYIVYPFDALEVISVRKPSPFQRISEMNVAFGNPKGDPNNIDWNRVRAQYRNIFDEYCEGLRALGMDETALSFIQTMHTRYTAPMYFMDECINPLEVRDALADQQVFKDGALHFMGVDGDADMHAVIDGVMTRFIKDDADKAATIALHAAKGVSDVYFEGEYPKMVMKSLRDQPDAPRGKFLKSASYTNTVFP